MRHIAVCRKCGHCITTSDWTHKSWQDAVWYGFCCDGKPHKGFMIPVDCGYLVVFEEQEL